MGSVVFLLKELLCSSLQNIKMKFLVLSAFVGLSQAGVLVSNAPANHFQAATAPADHFLAATAPADHFSAATAPAAHFNALLLQLTISLLLQLQLIIFQQQLLQ